MASVERSQFIPVSAHEAFAWHMRPGAFERLVPPWVSATVHERRGGIADGGSVRFSIKTGIAPSMSWHAQHGEFELDRQFTDEQISGPFARWIHRHLFEPDGAQSCILTDEIDYEMPLGPLGAKLGDWFVRPELECTLAWRQVRTRIDLERHATARGAKPWTVMIGGASGLIGTALREFLTTGGHRVISLVRRAARGPNEIKWDPAEGMIDADRLDACDAIVHLGGTSIARPFTSAHKRDVLESRIGPTGLLSRAIAGMRRPPRLFLCASAIGYYGSRDDEFLDESSQPGEGFLPEVAKAWEDATAPAAAAGVRTVNLRIGVVLSARGGALAAMLPAFRMGLGGRVGTGRQFMSWISLEDILGAIHHAIACDRLRGPVNATSPFPVTQADFAGALAGCLRRPSILPAPASAVRLLLGEMGQALLLDGARVHPGRLIESGYRFALPELDRALAFETGRLR